VRLMTLMTLQFFDTWRRELTSYEATNGTSTDSVETPFSSKSLKTMDFGLLSPPFASWAVESLSQQLFMGAYLMSTHLLESPEFRCSHLCHLGPYDFSL